MTDNEPLWGLLFMILTTIVVFPFAGWWALLIPATFTFTFIWLALFLTRGQRLFHQILRRM